MITETQENQAILYALGALTKSERLTFETELRANNELLEFVLGLQRAADALALIAPRMEPPLGLKARIMERIEAFEATTQTARKPLTTPRFPVGLHFQMANQTSGWKQLPIPGAWIKLLSLHHDRGYAVLMGKLEPGVRYPAHVNVGPEDVFILTGDLHVGDIELRAGDFHHADGGSRHEENFSVRGCTLLAVLTTDDPLVAFAGA